MSKRSYSGRKPLIGFFPLFYNLAETGRAILVAKRYMEYGGEAVFFSHGGRYEYMAEEIGCKIVRVQPIYSEEFIEHLWKCSRLEELNPPFSKKILVEHVENEIQAYQETGVKMVVSTNNFPSTISARAAGIPLVSITPRFIPHFTKYPDYAEFFPTQFIPEKIKLLVLNWIFPRVKTWIHPFNQVAKKYNTPRFKNSYDLAKGDYTLYTDFKEFIEVYEKTSYSLESDNEYYIGPIPLDELFIKTIPEKETREIEKKIEKHLQKPGRKILLTMGSSGDKKLFLKILQ
ncbi:MAG: hypothetical protein DRN05_03935, partial [Thermoplasmata archaeon]